MLGKGNYGSLTLSYLSMLVVYRQFLSASMRIKARGQTSRGLGTNGSKPSNEQRTTHECLKSIGFDWFEKWTLPNERESKTYSDCEVWARWEPQTREIQYGLDSSSL